MTRCKALVAVLIGLSLPWLAACGGPQRSCQDECSNSRAVRCSGTTAQSCARGANGCLQWTDRVDCSQTGQGCDSNTGDCGAPCPPQCPALDQTRCGGSVIETCSAGLQGCRSWLLGLDCATTSQACDDSSGIALCTGGGSCASPPAAPTGPTPADGATGLDSGATTSLDWDDAAGATRYAVFFGTACPPPTFPSPTFTAVTSSMLPSLSLQPGTNYCWQVVSLDAAGCATEGPIWSFQTSVTCTDPVAGAPTVTSADQTFPAGTTSGTYTLTFSEPVHDVDASLTWTPLSGSGTMTVTAQSASSYAISFSGVQNGDRYRLTIGTGVVDDCGNALAAPVTRTIAIAASVPPGSTCAAAADVTNVSFPYQLTGTFTDDPSNGGSCDPTPTNAVWFKYTPATTGTYLITVTNHTSSGAYSRLAAFEGDSCAPLGAELGCLTRDAASLTAQADLTGDTTYLFLFYTDGNAYSMINPSIAIQ